MQLIFHIVSNLKTQYLGHVYIISHFHCVFPFFNGQMYVSVKNGFPQQGSLLKLMEKLYRKLYKWHNQIFITSGGTTVLLQV